MPVGLGEHVGLARQRQQPCLLLRHVEVEIRVQLAVPGVHHVLVGVGHLRRADAHHLGAVLCQRTPAGRPRQHPRQVERPDARQRPVAIRQRLRRRVADPHDLQQRQTVDRRRMRMRLPFRAAAHHRADAAARVQRQFQFLGVPVRDLLRRRGAVAGAAEQVDGALQVVREGGVQVEPAAVPGRVEAGQSGVEHVAGGAVATQVLAGADGGAGMGDVQRDGLRPPRPKPPQVGRRQPDRRQRRRADGPEQVVGRQHRVVPGDGERDRLRREAGGAQHVVQRGRHFRAFDASLSDVGHGRSLPPLRASVSPFLHGCSPQISRDSRAGAG